VARARLRDLGITIDRYPPGRHNAITGVPGVLVGRSTLEYDMPVVSRGLGYNPTGSLRGLAYPGTSAPVRRVSPAPSPSDRSIRRRVDGVRASR
jgi:L-aminopeptidase/D-esterase-like protein